MPKYKIHQLLTIALGTSPQKGEHTNHEPFEINNPIGIEAVMKSEALENNHHKKVSTKLVGGIVS